MKANMKRALAAASPFAAFVIWSVFTTPSRSLIIVASLGAVVASIVIFRLMNKEQQ